MFGICLAPALTLSTSTTKAATPKASLPRYFKQPGLSSPGLLVTCHWPAETGVQEPAVIDEGRPVLLPLSMPRRSALEVLPLELVAF